MQRAIKTSFLLLFLLLFGFADAPAQDWVQTNGPTGTDIKSIIFNSKKEIFLLANILQRSSDQGRSWTPLLSNLTENAIISIAITRNDNIYVSFSCLNGCSHGILRSQDNGETWGQVSSHLATFLTAGPDSSIYAGGTSTTNGVDYYSFCIHSMNHGVNWDSVYITNDKMNSLAVDSNGVLFAGSDRNIFKSSDHGKSWKKIIISFLSGSYIKVEAGSKGGNIFISSQFDNSDTLLHSTDDGETWSYVPMGLSRVTGLFALGPSGRLLCPKYGSIKYSDDFGKSWSDFGGISQGIDTTFSQFFLTADADSGFYLKDNLRLVHASAPGSHPWKDLSFPIGTVNGLVVFPDGSLIASCPNGTNAYYGFWRTQDGGQLWTQSDNNNISDYIMPNTLVIDSAKEIIATGFHGDSYFSSDKGVSWATSWNGFAPSALRVHSFIVSPNGFIFAAADVAGSDDNNVMISKDNGKSWGIVETVKDRYITSFAINTSGNILAGGSNVIHVSSDTGKTWKKFTIDKNLTKDTNILVDALSTGPNENIFAHLTGYGMYTSSDNGVTWTSSNKGLHGATVYSLISSPHHNQFAATDSGVFKLNLGAQAWISYSKGIEENKILSLSINSEGLLFAGTDKSGVFKSTEKFEPTGWFDAGDVNFDTVYVGETVCKKVFIKNLGSIPYILKKSFYIVDNPFSIDTVSSSILPIKLNPNDSVSFSVCFHPPQPAVYSSEIIWNSDIDSSLTEFMKPKSSLSGIAVRKSSVKVIGHYSTFSVNPNPNSSNSVSVSFTDELQQVALISMHDILGREVYKSNINSGSKEFEVPIRDLPEGTYYIRIESGGKTVTEKFVKVKI
jgi:photosystem II stability/assembly factor-like uncharacterized protein